MRCNNRQELEAIQRAITPEIIYTVEEITIQYKNFYVMRIEVWLRISTHYIDGKRYTF